MGGDIRKTVTNWGLVVYFVCFRAACMRRHLHQRA